MKLSEIDRKKLGEKKVRNVVNFVQNLTLSEGEWAGKPMQMVPWQKELIEKVYGTLNEDGTRQYRLVYIEVPKKNGKSGLVSGLALYHFLADGEPGPEVVCAAVAREQAGTIFDVSQQMIVDSDMLSSMCKLAPSTKTIRRRGKRGRFRALSCDVRSKHGEKYSAVFIDELHAFPDRKLYDVLTVGTGASRRQQLIVVITTAGDKMDGICWQLHERAVAKLKAMENRAPWDEEPDQTFLPLIFAADEKDDPGDEQTWLKANPSARYMPSLLADLRKSWEEAKGKPVEEALFKQLRLNLWNQPTEERWLGTDIWDRAANITVDKEALKGGGGIGALDLSSNSDMTAWGMVFEAKDDPNAVEVLVRLWVPEAKLHDDKNPNKDLYNAWKEQGLLTVTPGDAIDYDVIEQQVLEDAATYGIKEFAVDYLFQSRQICQRLQAQGMEPVSFRQGFKTYGPAVSEYERMLLKSLVRHGGHPILRWQFENLRMERDKAGNLAPSKRNKHAKIDGQVVVIMAIDTWNRHKNAPKSEQPKPKYVLKDW